MIIKRIGLTTYYLLLKLKKETIISCLAKIVREPSNFASAPLRIDTQTVGKMPKILLFL